MTAVLIATDLDGSLLDDDYQFAAAMDAIAEVKRLGWKVAFSTSKTAAECIYWQRQLGVGDYFLPENGAAIIETQNDVTCTPLKIVGLPRQRILATLAELRQQGHNFEGFAELSVEALKIATGLSTEQAHHAAAREYSEPVSLGEDDLERASFVDALARRGLSAQRGGRFTTVSGHHDKGVALRCLQQILPHHHCLALGDSWNDIPMLACADTAGVISNAAVGYLELPGHKQILRSTLPASAGWAELVTTFIDEIKT